MGIDDDVTKSEVTSQGQFCFGILCLNKLSDGHQTWHEPRREPRAPKET